MADLKTAAPFSDLTTMILQSKKNLLITAAVLMTAGLAGLAPYMYFDHIRNGGAHTLPSVSAPVKSNTALVSGNPVDITISGAGINLPVINGYYYPSTKGWTLTLDKAQFATPSAKPNNLKGNTFIYGHAQVNIFYNLKKVKSGDTATITTDNGYKFTYKFAQTYATSPTDTSVFYYKGPPMLTLQTCSGSFWQNRQMYLFSFVKYEKA